LDAPQYTRPQVFRGQPVECCSPAIISRSTAGGVEKRSSGHCTDVGLLQHAALNQEDRALLSHLAAASDHGAGLGDVL
jgi:hypothetical protein